MLTAQQKFEVIVLSLIDYPEMNCVPLFVELNNQYISWKEYA